MHPKFEQAHLLSRQVIGAAIEVHRILGPGLLESIYERCLIRELEMRGISSISQQKVRIDYRVSYSRKHCGSTFLLKAASSSRQKPWKEFCLSTKQSR
jgi:GxxExxY protein